MYVRRCVICEKRKAFGSSKAPLVPIDPPSRPWQLMAMDVVGPLELTEKGTLFILVMGEYSTRYMIAEPMKDQTAESVHDAFLRRIVLVHGVPEEVLTDQGTNFLSKTMDELYKQLGVKRKRTTAYRPCCDGLVERFNRTLGDMLASYVSKGSKNWDEFVSHATFAYNTAVHAGTGYTPHYLMFGRDPKEPEDVLSPVRNELITDRNMIFAKMWNLAKETARERLIESQVKQKHYYDKGTKIINYGMGDQVLLKELDDKPGKFNMRWEGPYTVIGKTSGVNYKLRKRDGTNYVTHVDRMKRFHTKDNVPTPVHQREASANEPQALNDSNKEAPTKTKANSVQPIPSKNNEPEKRQLRRQVTLPRRFKDFVVDMRRN